LTIYFNVVIGLAISNIDLFNIFIRSRIQIPLNA